MSTSRIELVLVMICTSCMHTDYVIFFGILVYCLMGLESLC